MGALAFFVSFSAIASAQYMTQDVVFVKFGYIPMYNVTSESEGEESDTDATGFALQGEYNLNFSGFWLGFGMEYQYITQDLETVKLKHHFLVPMASIKIAAVGGLYVGGGLSGKYLIATESYDIAGDSYESKKDIDLWANGILGYHQPIGEGIFLDLEGRFGWNLTNRQFSKTDPDTGKADVTRAYDIGFYAGVGFRAIGSNY
jgi:hypothetical protein